MPFIELNVWGDNEPAKVEAGNVPKVKSNPEKKEVKTAKKPQKKTLEKVDAPKPLKGKEAKAKKAEPLALTIVRAADY